MQFGCRLCSFFAFDLEYLIHYAYTLTDLRSRCGSGIFPDIFNGINPFGRSTLSYSCMFILRQAYSRPNKDLSIRLSYNLTALHSRIPPLYLLYFVRHVVCRCLLCH